MLELRNKLLLLGLEGEASLIPTFTLDPRLIGAEYVESEAFLKDLKQVALMSTSNFQVLSSSQLAILAKDKPSSSYLSGGQV